jgi:hypothetical protein
MLARDGEALDRGGARGAERGGDAVIEDRTRELGRAMDPRWKRDDVERGLGRLHRGLRARRRTRAMIVGAAMTAVIAGAIAFAATRGGGDETATLPSTARGGSAAAPAPLPIPGSGSQLVTSRAVATPLSPDTIVFAADNATDAVAMRLDRGAARFAVTPDAAHPFRVEAGPVIVEVLGTEFTIDRGEERATVAVVHGVVRVHWRGGATVLRTGEAGVFPPSGATPTAAGAGAVSASDPDELLVAADRARESGELAEAERLLLRALGSGISGSREAAAAFTLAKVQARRGAHAAAAASFARVGAADPEGALAEDALAREAQAWADAGDAVKAAAAARRYLARYPGGLHEGSVRRFAPEP